MQLTDRVIVITGGSKGFGKALARGLKQEGARVIIASHHRESLEAAAQELGVDAYLVDVTVYEDVKRLELYTTGKYGRIDMWINNAGVLTRSLVEDTDREKVRALMDVNFFGTLYGCQVALEQMKRQGSGAIVNVNSVVGLDGRAELGVYSASKFAVRGLTESIRREIEGLDIQVYAVFPGGMKTDLHKESDPIDFQEYMDPASVAEKVIANLKREMPEPDLIIRRPKK